MCCNGVGNASRIIQLTQVLQQVIRVFIVLFEETGKLFDGCFGHRPLLVSSDIVHFRLSIIAITRLQIVAIVLPLLYFNTPQAFYEHFDGAIRQFRHLDDTANRADRMQIGNFRFAHSSVFLRHQQQLFLVFFVSSFQGGNGFFSADEERHDNVRVNDDVAQWQYGKVVFLHQVSSVQAVAFWCVWGALPCRMVSAVTVTLLMSF